MTSSTNPGSGGLIIPSEMRDILDQPGYLSIEKGGSRLRGLHQRQSMSFNPGLLSEFAFYCFFGELSYVTEAVATRTDLNLLGTETPFKLGYATLIVFGAQRIVPAGTTPTTKHADVLKFLLSHGMPADVEDILGYTAIHHATMNNASPLGLVRILLESGANVNHRDRCGAVPLLAPFMANDIPAIDLLMEFGADLNIKDADGVNPSNLFLQCGPQVTAAVRKWMRKRAGEHAPLDGKKCDNCGKEANAKLSRCSRCLTAFYCGTQCQRTHWATHKPLCKSLSASTTVTLKPIYGRFDNLLPMAALHRQFQGVPSEPTPERNFRGAQSPKAQSYPKTTVIKVQVPFSLPDESGPGGPAMGQGSLLIYNKKRDLVCSVDRSGNPLGYDRITQVVRSQGVGGAKAYFSAELRSKDELIVKVSEVLAEQPF